MELVRFNYVLEVVILRICNLLYDCVFKKPYKVRVWKQRVLLSGWRSRPCACAIDHCSRACQKSTRALANQSAHTSAWANPNATFQLRQSGRVSCRHAYPAIGEFLDISARRAYTRSLHATSRQRLYFSNIIFRPSYCVFGHRAILSWDWQRVTSLASTLIFG